MTEKSSHQDSPKATQPTPFGIADILSNGKHHQNQIKIINEDYYFRTLRDNSNSNKISEKSTLEQHQIFSSHLQRLTCADAQMLRRATAAAGIGGFGGLTISPSFKHLDAIANFTVRNKESCRTSSEQQDEALDMSKSKFIGEFFF